MSSHDQLARELLSVALRQSGLAFSGEDQLRLAGELAQFLDEGRIISKAVPTSLEPQTMVVFEDPTDAT